MVSATGVLCLALAAPIGAQVQTQTSTAPTGPPTHKVMVESGEVVAVEGNDLFVKMADGSLRHFPNIPESATVTVEGQQLNIHQLKPGMKLERTTVTSTTNQMVTTVQTVTGKVWHVTPPRTVILTLEDGTNQQFNIPKGQKFMVDGRETDAFGLRKGMVVSATKIVESPESVISQQRHTTGTMPPIPPDQPVLVARGEPKPAPAAAAPTAPAATETAPATETAAATTAPKRLPKTGSDLPLIGLLGLLSISASLAMRMLRKSQN